MLPLDDNRWRELAHRGWWRGQRHQLDPDAPYVPDELRVLLENPRDLARFRNLYPYLTSEGTTWEAAYAATPYIVEIAKQLSPKERFEPLIAIGFVVINSCPDSGDGFEVKSFLAEAYEKALSDTLPLLVEALLEEHNAMDTRYLLAATAALKGHAKLGKLIETLDCYAQCPDCEAEIYELCE
jgi:hypothetical protein